MVSKQSIKSCLKLFCLSPGCFEIVAYRKGCIASGAHNSLFVLGVRGCESVD